MISFTVYGLPQTAGSKRAFVNKKTGRAIVTDDNKKSRPWKTQVSQVAAETFGEQELLRGPLSVEFHFYLPRPKGHYTSKGALTKNAPSHHTQKPDTLKLARAVEDALSGVVYGDDCQIVDELIVKHWGGKARVEVVIKQVDVATQNHAEAS